MTELFYSVLLYTSVFVSTLYLLLIILYSIGWKKTQTFKVLDAHIFSTTVSIVIAARNEESTIENCLNHLLNQDFPNHLMEIIVMDDCSEDKTAEKVRQIISQHPQKKIQLLCIDKSEINFSSKKKAIVKAIEISTSQLIITTDADCWMNVNWLKTIVAFYETTKAKMIVAPVIIPHEEKLFSLTNFQSIDFMSLVACGGASLYFNKPLMCNGANLIFERIAYNQVQAEMGGNHLVSGDDMFLMLAIKNKFPNSIKFLKSKGAVVYTHAQANLSLLMHQRKRWASKGFQYHDAYINFVSLLVFALHLCMLITVCISFFRVEALLLFFGLFLSKIIVDFIFLNQVTSFFGNKKLLRGFIFAEIANIAFINMIAVLSQTKKYVWKGRRVE